MKTRGMCNVTLSKDPGSYVLAICNPFHFSIFQTGSERKAELKVTSLPGCSTISNGLGISAPTSFAVGSNLIAAGVYQSQTS